VNLFIRFTPNGDCSHKKNFCHSLVHSNISGIGLKMATKTVAETCT